MDTRENRALKLRAVRGIPAELGDTREFHVSKTARDRYGFDEGLFALSGNVVFADFHAARAFAEAMNRERDLLRHPEQAVRAGDVNAMGIIDEVMHHLVSVYLESVGDDLFNEALEHLKEEHGEGPVEAVLERFISDFPPRSVRAGEKTPREYLDGKVEGRTGRERAAEELLMLRLENENPAFSPFGELFDEAELVDYERIDEQWLYE